MNFSTYELAKYLKTIREDLGYSIYDVNKLCEISPSYLSLMENGKRRPSPIILKKLSSIYHVNYNDLLKKAGFEDLIENEKTEMLKKVGAISLSDIEAVAVPLLGTVKAGYDYMAQENWEGIIEVDKDIIKDGSDYFALKIKGDSMYPVLIEGDIVIIKKQEDFENGDIVVAIINGNEATIKKGKKSESSILLQPFNNNYEPLIFTNEEIKTIPVTIVGIVKQLKREF